MVRAPESLDLQHSVLQDPLSATSAAVGLIGRTQLALTLRSAGVQVLRVLADPGSRQVVLLPSAVGVWTPGTYELNFTYHRDFGDDIAAGSHRYDRPVERRGGQRDPEGATITWTVT
jgi:hypothetical protein